MDCEEFLIKVGWDNKKPVEEFALVVKELENKQNRPVYFGEVLYFLNEKSGADGKFSGDLIKNLRKLNNKAQKKGLVGAAKIEDVKKVCELFMSMPPASIAEHLKKYLDVASDPEKYFREQIIPKKIEAISRWKGIKAKEIFPKNEPFLYYVPHQYVKGDDVVAGSFATWLLNTISRKLDPVS